MSRLEIVNHSHLSPSWHWLEHRVAAPDIVWRHHSSLQHSRLTRMRLGGTYASRLAAAHGAVRAASSAPNALLVSHGPRPAYYAGRLAQLRRRADIPHLVYSFNFTTLPGEAMRREMTRAYRSIDRFAVFSSMERTLYAEYFDIDPARIDMLHWAIAPEDPARLPRPPIDGRYICAVGSQGRDYRVLLEAARYLPGIPLHLVVHKENIQGLDVPPSVTVHTSIPHAVASGIVAHADVMALPLLHSRVPCGHVTAVLAMHMGKAIAATDSVGLHDYLRHGDTASLVEPGNPRALAEAIEHLWNDPAAARALGDRAQSFARRHCLESHVADYFIAYLRRRMGRVLPDGGAGHGADGAQSRESS